MNNKIHSLTFSRLYRYKTVFCPSGISTVRRILNVITVMFAEPEKGLSIKMNNIIDVKRYRLFSGHNKSFNDNEFNEEKLKKILMLRLLGNMSVKSCQRERLNLDPWIAGKKQKVPNSPNINQSNKPFNKPENINNEYYLFIFYLPLYLLSLLFFLTVPVVKNFEYHP